MLAEDVDSLSQDRTELGGDDGSQRRGLRYLRFEIVHELEQFLGEGGLLAVDRHEALRRRQRLLDQWT